MLSANFYDCGVEIGYLEIRPVDEYTGVEEVGTYGVRWTGTLEDEDVATSVVFEDGDSIRDLFAMALVEVDAILAERAVN